MASVQSVCFGGRLCFIKSIVDSIMVANQDTVNPYVIKVGLERSDLDAIRSLVRD